MKLASKYLAGILTLAVGAVSLGFGVSEDVVNFGEMPSKGLKFKVVETMKGEIEGTMTFQDNEQELKQIIERKHVFTQTLTDVGDGRIKKLSRSYEDAMQKIVMENEAMPEPFEREMESPVAWKEVRAEFDGDGGVKLEVKDGDEWGDADDKVKKRLTRTQLLHPGVPLPKGEKRVGETWEMTDKQIKEYFSGMSGPEEQAEVEIDGSGKLELVEVKEIKDQGKCAVIKFKFEVKMSLSEGPSPAITLSGTANYSLEHKIVVGVKSVGKMKVEGEMEQMGTTIEMNMGGDLKSEYKVKVLPKSQG